MPVLPYMGTVAQAMLRRGQPVALCMAMSGQKGKKGHHQPPCLSGLLSHLAPLILQESGMVGIYNIQNQ